MCLQFHNTDTFSLLRPYPFSSLSLHCFFGTHVVQNEAFVNPKMTLFVLWKLGQISLRCPPRSTKSFKSMVGGFKSSSSLIRIPSSLNHGHPRVDRGVRSAATSGMPTTRRLRARRLTLSPSRLTSMQWQNSRDRLTPVPL